MIEDENSRTSANDADLLLYDYFKHLTSLSIVILGGVLIVAQSADPADVKRWLVAVVLILISAGGILAFTGTGEIVRARSTGAPVQWTVRWSRVVAPVLLATGVGMFLSMFVDSLD